MYYIIEKIYTGANREQFIDFDHVFIATEPDNCHGGTQIIDGFVKSYNDVSTYGHGEFLTIEDAMSAIKSIFGEVREDHEHKYLDSEIVAVFRMGKFEPCSLSNSINFFQDSIESDISSSTDNLQIAKLWEKYNQILNDECKATIDNGLNQYMIEYRDSLINKN